MNGHVRAARSIRLARGLKLREVAAAAGVTVAQVSRIESGESGGSITVLRRIAGALDVTIDELLATADPEPAVNVG